MSEVKEHSVIYLSPSDDPEREWCQDDVWEESVRYNLGTDFDRVTAERDALQVRVNELLEDFQELSEQSERRGRQASEFEDCMGELQVENGKLQDRINLLSDSGEHVESHLENQADILRIRCDSLQALLTAADERADVMAQALHALSALIGLPINGPQASQDELLTIIWEALGEEDAALKPAESAKCARCECSTVEACDERGCGFLGSGNGAP